MESVRDNGVQKLRHDVPPAKNKLRYCLLSVRMSLTDFLQGHFTAQSATLYARHACELGWRSLRGKSTGTELLELVMTVVIETRHPTYDARSRGLGKLVTWQGLARMKGASSSSSRKNISDSESDERDR